MQQIITTMPEIFRFFGFSFMFYSNEHEPIHVHVRKGSNGKFIEAKFDWSDEQQKFILVYNHGVKASEMNHIQSIIDENADIIRNTWSKYFYND